MAATVGEIVAHLKIDGSQFYAELDKAQARAEALNATDPKIKVTTEGTAKAVTELDFVSAAEDRVEKSTRKVSAAQKDGQKQAVDWRGALIGSLVAVSAAAPPVAAAAVGITAAFGVMGGAGVLGLAGIARGLKENNAIGQEYRGTVNSLTASLHSAEDAASNGLFPGVQASAALLKQDMPVLNGEVDHFAGLLGGMLPTGLDATVTLIERANPLLNASAGYLGRLIQGVDSWAHGNGYRDFLDYSIRELPQVERFLGDTGHLVGDFLTAWAPLGSTTLPMLDTLVGSIDDLVKRTGPLVPATIAVVGAYKLLNPAIGWVKGLRTEVTLLGDAEVATAAKATRLSALLPFLAKGGAAASSGLGQTLALSSMGLGAAAGVGAGMAVGDSYETSNLNPQLLGQSSYTKGVAGRSGGAPAIDSALAAMVNSGNAAKAASQFAQVKTAADRLGMSTKELTADFPKYTSAVGGAAKTSTTATGSTKLYTAALTAQTPITKNLTADQQAQVIALRAVAEGYRSTMAAAELLGNSYDDVTIAQGNLIASFKQQAKASKTGKVSLDENTVAGAQNAEQMRGAVDKIKAHADAINADGKHAAAARQYTLEHAQSLEEQAIKAGADKGKVDALVGSLIAVSKTHPVAKVDIQTARAMSQLEALQNKLGELNGYTSWVYVNLAGTAADAAGTAGQVARNAIYGRADGGTIEGHADGGTVYGRGTASTDSVLRRLSVGEEVTSDKRGQASFWRPALKAMNAGMAPAAVVRATAAVAGVQAPSEDHHVHIHVSGDDSALTQMMRVEVSQGAKRQEARDARTQRMGWQGKGLLAAPTGV